MVPVAQLWVDAWMAWASLGGNDGGRSRTVGTDGSLGGLFAPRSASRRPFTNPAASAISMVNSTAVDIFHDIAQFAGNAAIAVHGSLAAPAAAPHNDASRADGGSVQGAHQGTASGGAIKGVASSAASAASTSASGMAGNTVQGAHHDTPAAGTPADGIAQPTASNTQVPGAASMHRGIGSVAVAADQSAGHVASGPAHGAPPDTSAAGTSADGSAGSMASYQELPIAARVHNDVGSAITAADQGALQIASSANGHALAVEQLANSTSSRVKAQLPASRAELQQQGNEAQAGEDHLQRELDQRDAALQAQITQQAAKLRRQEHTTRRQAGKITQQNVTITDLITQINMNNTNYNGPCVMNGTLGSTGALAVCADHVGALHAAACRVQLDPLMTWQCKD